MSQQSLLAHVNMLHTGDNPGPTFQCDQCGKRLTRKVLLYLVDVSSSLKMFII